MLRCQSCRERENELDLTIACCRPSESFSLAPPETKFVFFPTFSVNCNMWEQGGALGSDNKDKIYKKEQHTHRSYN